MPTSIVCDTDPAFTSLFWRELFQLNGTKFNFNSSYHPQTDCQTEVVNKTLEMYLHCFTSSNPKKWVTWLSWVEYYCYNTSMHSATKRSPFEIVSGKLPPTLLGYAPGIAKVAAVEDLLLQRYVLIYIHEVRQQLQQAENRMKQVYAKGHQEQ